MAKKRKKYVMTAAHKKKLREAAAKRKGVKRGPYKQNKVITGYVSKTASPFGSSVRHEIERLKEQISLLEKLL